MDELFVAQPIGGFWAAVSSEIRITFCVSVPEAAKRGGCARIRERVIADPPKVCSWHTRGFSPRAAILIEPDVLKTQGISVPDPKRSLQGRGRTSWHTSCVTNAF
jgi:hypothetical protein